MDKLGDGPLGGLWFNGTPALQYDRELARLAEIDDHTQRAKKTIAYLKTLPPWPEPLPWLANAGSPPPQAHNPQPPRQEPPLTRATAALKTPAKHVKFLLSQPRLTQFTAKEVAGQIRWALKDVKRATNSLPDPLATIEEIADALDDLGNTRLEPKDKQRVQDLNLRIAQLEAVVEKLTAQLSDSEKARETAEALAKSQGFQGQFMSELATETVRTGGFIVRTGAVGGGDLLPWSGQPDCRRDAWRSGSAEIGHLQTTSQKPKSPHKCEGFFDDGAVDGARTRDPRRDRPVL